MVRETISSAPAKIILLGEHGVNRQQTALATAVDLRTYCRVSPREDGRFTLLSGDRQDELGAPDILAYKEKIDQLRSDKAIDAIREEAKEFFAPTRYVLGQLLSQLGPNGVSGGLNIEWKSKLPIGSGLGSGAAAATSMAKAVYGAIGREIAKEEIVQAAWQGDIIAHGGVASSLDSSTATYGGLIRYSVAGGAEVMPGKQALAVVIGDTLVQHNTAALNTHVRRWLEGEPVHMHYFQDMGWLVDKAITAITDDDPKTLGHIMNLHQLIQEKMGTSIPQAEAMITAALGAGALGAKISGSGGGGIIIALVDDVSSEAVCAALTAAGGRAYSVRTGSAGVQLEDEIRWDEL
jgi:mevalonate kinase